MIDKARLLRDDQARRSVRRALAKIFSTKPPPEEARTDLNWSWAPSQRYVTGGEADPIDLFHGALPQSDYYARGTAFFTSALFQLTIDSVADFVLRGGQIALITSTILDPKTVRTLVDPTKLVGRIRQALRTELTAVHDGTGQENGSEQRLRFVATLLVHDRLRVKVALPVRTTPTGIALRHGMYHEKLGLLANKSGQAISFVGSVNETLRAWDEFDGNYESFDAFSTEKAPNRVKAHAQALASHWSPGGSSGLRTFDMTSDLRGQLSALALSLDSRGLKRLVSQIAAVSEVSESTLETPGSSGLGV